jgi:hypothetical protein
MGTKIYPIRARVFMLMVISITFFLTACGTTPGEANLETAATPTINTRSRFILPPDGRDTALTCQGIAGKTAIRTLRISGGVRLDMITPTFETLLSKTSARVDIPFSRTRDANLSGGIRPQGGAAFIRDLSGKNVAVLPWGGVLQFAGPLQNLTPGDFINSSTSMRIELIRPGARPTGDDPRQRFLPVNTTDFNRLFTPVFGPVGLDGSNFSSSYFVLVLEESKGYAAGRGYLVSNDILNPLSSNTFIFPDATYFEENGLGILGGPSVYATFNCRVNLIEP